MVPVAAIRISPMRQHTRIAVTIYRVHSTTAIFIIAYSNRRFAGDGYLDRETCWPATGPYEASTTDRLKEDALSCRASFLV